MEWVLIFLVGSTFTSFPGFTSQEECNKGARQIVKAFNLRVSDQGGPGLKMMCMYRERLNGDHKRETSEAK